MKSPSSWSQRSHSWPPSPWQTRYPVAASRDHCEPGRSLPAPEAAREPSPRAWVRPWPGGRSSLADHDRGHLGRSASSAASTTQLEPSRKISIIHEKRIERPPCEGQREGQLNRTGRFDEIDWNRLNVTTADFAQPARSASAAGNASVFSTPRSRHTSSTAELNSICRPERAPETLSP